MMAMSFEGSPISANKYWRSIVVNGRIRVIVSEEAKAFKTKMFWMAKAHKFKKLSCPVSVSITWHRKTEKQLGDADNISKVLLDSLNGVAYDDDKQVFQLFIEKKISGFEKTEIIIKPLEI